MPVCAGSAIYSRPVRFVCRPASLTCSLAHCGRRTLKRQLTIVHEAQRARGVPLDEGWYQRLRAMPARRAAYAKCAWHDLTIRGAALDMRGFGTSGRTTLGTGVLQRVCAVWHGTANTGGSGSMWIWLR